MDHAPRFSRRETLKAGAAIAASVALPAALAAQAPARLKLRLLETTDLHVNVVPYDYFRDAALWSRMALNSLPSFQPGHLAERASSSPIV